MRALLIAVLAVGPAWAEDFSVGSEAQSWNLYAEKPARFEARVVDLLCEIAGDCVPDCGGGRRQLGLLRSADGVLVYPNKNGQPLFTGAVAELLPYCGQEIEVDGLMIDDPDIGAVNIYQLQKLRAAGTEAWVKAETWTKEWETAHPEAAGDGPWFRRDPRVNAAIAAEGWFGLGLERDREILGELFP